MPTLHQNADIPNLIHFFWAGSPLREAELKNIMTFLFHTDETWTIKVWTDRAVYITKPLAHHDIDCPRIEVCEYGDVANESIRDMKESVSDPESQHALQVSLETLQRLSIGLKHPAVVKDIFSLMLMYHEGGYFFDLDSFAHKTIDAQKASRGILIPCDLNIIGSLASQPKLNFWCEALMQIQGNLSHRFFLERRRGNFFDLSGLKSKVDLKERTYNSGLITGQILPRLVNKKDHEAAERNDTDYKHDLCFELEPSDRFWTTTRKTLMGVTLRVDQDDSSGWRKGSDPQYAFDDIDYSLK